MEKLPTTTTPVNMLTATHTDGPAFNTRSCTQQNSSVDNTTTPPDISPDTSPTPKSLTADRLEAILQMQKTDPFCKHVSKCLISGKAPKHETDVFTHSNGLLYKHIMDSGKNFLTLVIPKSWKYTF